MKIGVLCNGKVGLPSMQVLAQTGHQLVVFIPDKKVPEHDEINAFAQYYGIPVIVVSKNNLTEQLLFAKSSYLLEYFFVMTFSYILSDELLNNPSFPIFNFHYAPLPEYRGAQPVFWMIRNGEKEGGVTVHLMAAEVDAGEVLIFDPLPLEEDDTFGIYMEKIAQLSCRTVMQLVQLLSTEGWKKNLKKQDESKAKYWKAPGINDIVISWSEMTAKEIKRICLATNPWNKGVFTSFNGKTLKLICVEIEESKKEGLTAGTITSLSRKGEYGIYTRDKHIIVPKVIYTEEGFFYRDYDKLFGFYDGGSLT